MGILQKCHWHWLTKLLPGIWSTRDRRHSRRGKVPSNSPNYTVKKQKDVTRACTSTNICLKWCLRILRNLPRGLWKAFCLEKILIIKHFLHISPSFTGSAVIAMGLGFHFAFASVGSLWAALESIQSDLALCRCCGTRRGPCEPESSLTSFEKEAHGPPLHLAYWLINHFLTFLLELSVNSLLPFENILISPWVEGSACVGSFLLLNVRRAISLLELLFSYPLSPVPFRECQLAKFLFRSEKERGNVNKYGSRITVLVKCLTKRKVVFFFFHQSWTLAWVQSSCPEIN